MCVSEPEKVSHTRIQHKGRKEWSKGEGQAERGGVAHNKAIYGETGCVMVYLGYVPAGYVFSQLFSWVTLAPSPLVASI